VKVQRLLLPIIILALLVVTGCIGKPTPTSKPTETPVPMPSIEDIVAVVSESVVRIITPESMGSGMVIEQNGYVLTNSHVVEGITNVIVESSNGKQWKGSVTGRDEINDLAVVKIDSTNLPTVTLGNSDELRPGQEVIAIGYPLDLAGSVTVTKGIISAIRQYDLVQTDVAINPGNSGGPLVNLMGEVVGVNFAGISGSRDQPVEGMNFAVSINLAKEVIPALKDGVSTPTSTQTPTPTPTPTPKPTPTPTPTPSPTPTPTPSPNPSPTPTPSPAPIEPVP